MSFHSVDDNPPLARSVDRSQGHQVARCAWAEVRFLAKLN